MSTSARALHVPALPLRLAAEPHAKSIWHACVALGVHMQQQQEEEEPSSSSTAHAHATTLDVAVLVDDDGVRAFAFSGPVSRRVFLEFVGFPHNGPRSAAADCCGASTGASDGWKTGPLPCLVRTSPTSNDMEWHMYREGDEFPTKSSEGEVASTAAGLAFHDGFIARLLTESIRIYYAQQILEPSVRGFLSVLEKQFARSDLYLFELLQNAVDDGASVVRFSCRADGQHRGLRVTHNGRNFTPLDVLGLSSVGLSTKSREGKRTIGFMGVGFKAVYKRFSRVVIDDGTYAFAYEKPTDTSSAGATSGYGWVMQPLWIDNESREQPVAGTETWCHFQLERPAGGMGAIERDLAVLPQTAPPLLGRAALEKRSTNEESDHSWTLDWNKKVHKIRRVDMVGLDARSGPFSDAKDRSEVVTVDITDRSGHATTTRWLFVSHKYVPSKEAARSYHVHTKRSHSGEEEVCGFVRLGGEDGRTPLFRVSARTGSLMGGIVHSVLPTKLRMPVPMNVQGAWLLSVDRQEVQDLGDNEWNRDLVHRLPLLIANFFRWAAQERLSSAAQYGAICKLLPALASPSSPTSSSLTEFLGQTVSLKGLERVLFSERILPVALAPESKKERSEDAMDVDTRDEKPATGYYEGERSVWVPPSWFKFLEAETLRGWLGKRPLRTDLMGDAAYHPLFSSKAVIGQLDVVPTRKEHLAREIGRQVTPSSVGVVLRLMASVGAAYDEHPESSNAEALSKTRSSSAARPGNDTNSKNVSQAPYFPSSATAWPLFLTERGELSSLDKVVLPADDFASAPEDLRALLRPFFIPQCVLEKDVVRNQHKKGKCKKRGRDNYRGGQQYRTQAPPPRVPQKQRLHPMLEAAIYRVDSGCTDMSENVAIIKCQSEGEVSEYAASFLSRARLEAPANAIGVATAATNLLVSYCKIPVCREEHVFAVLRIAEFALSTSNPSLLTHVLVDTSPPPVASRSSSSSYSPSNNVRVIPAGEAYIGKALDEGGSGADLENFAEHSLQFVSSMYSNIAASAAERQKLVGLLDLAGVQSGLSTTITAIVDLEKSDRQFLATEVLPSLPEKRLPKTRKNPTKNPINLPYGIGVLDKRKYSLLDAELSREWEKIVNEMSPDAAVSFVSLLLAIPVDDAVNITGKTTPAASKLLAGQAEIDAKEDAKYERNNGSAQTKTVRIAKDTAVPLRRRLYFLPPGQPGGSALDVSSASIIRQLSSWKWLPCSIPSQSDTQTTLMLCRPEEAMLAPDSSRPEMPVVQLPPSVLKSLSSSAIAKALVWGTRAPPPPVTRLAELTREANDLVSSPAGGYNADRSNVSRIASELISTWTAIARAHLRDSGLSARDRNKLRSICEGSHCMPVRQAFEANASSSWITPVSRCILMPESLGASTGDERDRFKRLTVASFVASNFMHDFNSIKSNPFFSQPNVSGAVIQLANISTLSRLPIRNLITTSGAFVHHCCAAEPIVSRSSPLRSSFSFAMKWCLESPNELPKDGVGGLKLFVRRGPGIGAKALPARWVSLKNGPVQIALDDDKSRARYSLLTSGPEMGVQLLGVLDHFPNDRDCPDAEILSAIDREVIDYCRVMRLSDKRFHVKTKARGTPTVIDGASFRLQLVCALIKAMDIDRLKDGGSATSPSAASIGGDFLDPKYEPPLIIRHESLTREFKAPWMKSPSLTLLFAAWGRAPKHLTSKRCVLVSGEPEDYTVELEQLVLNHVDVRLASSLASTKDYRAALRLLSHLESDTSFEKFLERDFSDSEVTLRWRKLSERRQILERLKVIENGKDAKALRSALVKAEEACEDDDDGGDAVLKSARELLPKLEEEAQNRREIEERKKAEEREREAAREASLKEEKEAFERWKDEEKEKALSKRAGDVAAGASAAAPRGRGRGLTLPAWVTSGTGPSKPATEDTALDPVGPKDTDPFCSTPNAMEEAKSLVLSIMSEGGVMTQSNPSGQSLSERNGRGRGDSNLPASMAPESEVTAEPANPAPQPTNGAGRGRGRGRGGVSNLPAWMTSASSNPPFADEENGLKRSRLEMQPEHSTLEQAKPGKKARIEASSFEFSLKVSLKPSDLPEFIAWLRPKIEEGARRHNGTVAFDRVDS